MQAKILLEKNIKGVLQEINKLGLCPELNKQYRRIYNRLKEFAEKKNIYSFALIQDFLEEIEQKYMSGVIGLYRRSHLRRASFLLRDYIEHKRIEWKVYVVNTSPLPSSQEFLFLYSQFIENNQSSGWSENTIQSSKNLIRQFLIYLEDKGCSTFSMVTPSMIPSFFQHLLATYSPGSIRTVASHIRSFLKFVEGGERLLPLIPSRCIRKKSIIPILSKDEYTALNSTLKNQKISLRDKAIILLALQTGLRSIDIIRIKLKDIDWINDIISFIQSKTGKLSKIPLTPETGNVLSAYILNERPNTNNPYVFLRSMAPYKPLSEHSACYALLSKVFQQAGIRLGNERKGMHLLRHSIASLMLSKGIPVTTISSLLGHSNKASTNIYLSTDEEQMKECALDLSVIPMNCGGLQ